MQLDTGKVPADLFFEGTIPLMDCVLFLDYPDTESPARVVIFDGYHEALTTPIEGGEGVVVGVIELLYTLDTYCPMYMPIVAAHGRDNLLFIGCASTADKVSKKRAEDSMPLWVVWELFFGVMNVWYGIQLSLLHPLTQRVYAKPRSGESVYAAELYKRKSTNTAKRKAKHIKKHIIDVPLLDRVQEEVLNELKVEGKARNRKTLVWYVIGTFRWKGTPKQTWVRPHWKGPLRHLKKNIDKGREREVALEDKNAG
jgi:hypothetical protein